MQEKSKKTLIEHVQSNIKNYKFKVFKELNRIEAQKTKIMPRLFIIGTIVPIGILTGIFRFKHFKYYKYFTLKYRNVRIL